MKKIDKLNSSIFRELTESKFEVYKKNYELRGIHRNNLIKTFYNYEDAAEYTKYKLKSFLDCDFSQSSFGQELTEEYIKEAMSIL